jgi:membrane protein
MTGRADESAMRAALRKAGRLARLGGLRVYRLALKGAQRTFALRRVGRAMLARLLGRVFYDAYMKFVADDGWPIASHIALSILTSMFSFLIFVTALAGFFGTKDLADGAAQLLFEAWPQRVAAPLSAEIHNVLTQPRTGLLGVGAFLAIYFSASGVEALRIGLDRAYNAKDERRWWLLRLEAILFVILSAIALLSFAVLLVFAPLAWAKAQYYAPLVTTPLEYLYAPVRFGVVTTILLLVLVFMHKFLAAGRRSLRMIAPGVALTLAAWLGFGVLFGSYLAEYAANYVSTYAGLASIVIILVFLNTLGAIFMFGAELNATIEAERAKRINGP